MAATVVFNGTSIATVEDNTGFSVIKISGTGGTPSPISETDVVKIGSGSCSVQVNRQRNILWFDIGAGNELDFTGTEAGQVVAIWATFLAAGLLNTTFSPSAGGYAICLGTDTSNYGLWNIGGNDGGTPGSWIRYIIDPTKGMTFETGTFNPASVRYFGMMADVGGTTAKFANLVIDNIDYGYGLRVYGTSTTDDLFQDILDDEASNGYGFIREDNGIFYIHGQYLLGDNIGTNGSTLTDANKVIVFESKEYWLDVTDDWVPAGVSNYNQFKRVGNSSNGTDLTIGDGMVIQAGLGFDSEVPDVDIDLDDGHTGSGLDLTVDGARFSQINGLFALSANPNFEFKNTTVNNCIEVTGSADGSDGIVIRDCVFQNYSGESAAIHWANKTNMDMQDCDFRNNNGGANSSAIRHTAGGVGSVTYNNLYFDNNDYDVYLNHASDNLTVDNTGISNASTYISSGSGTVTFNTPVVFLVTQLKTGSEVRLYRVSDDQELGIGVESSGTTWQYNYSWGGDVPCYLVVLHIDWVILRIPITLIATDQTYPVSYVTDRVYDNP